MDESNIISTVSENMVWNLKRGGVASNSYANDRYSEWSSYEPSELTEILP